MGDDRVSLESSDGLQVLTSKEIEVYLERIGCEGPVTPGRAALEVLHFAHIHAVVFENLDVHLGRPIEIDIPKIFDKIVRRGRGGFCFELNTLFASLLHSLGYDVTVHAARVVAPGSRWIPFGHLCLNVVCEGKTWLVDVGFGNSFQRPLEIGRSDVQCDEGGDHTLEPVEEGWLLRSRIYSDSFDPEYRFDLTPRHFHEFEERCRWTQTAHDSGFTRNIMATQPTPAGRRTVLGFALREFANGESSERQITAEERARIFIADFGLPSEDVEALPPGIRADRFPDEVDMGPPGENDPTV